VAVSTSSLRRFTGWLADRDALPAEPSAITRGLLEDYRAHVHTLPVAKVAIARKLLTLCYYGLRDGEIRCLNVPDRRAR
jgi:hypothetical protein